MAPLAKRLLWPRRLPALLSGLAEISDISVFNVRGSLHIYTGSGGTMGQLPTGAVLAIGPEAR